MALLEAVRPCCDEVSWDVIFSAVSLLVLLELLFLRVKKRRAELGVV